MQRNCSFIKKRGPASLPVHIEYRSFHKDPFAGAGSRRQGGNLTLKDLPVEALLYGEVTAGGISLSPSGSFAGSVGWALCSVFLQKSCVPPVGVGHPVGCGLVGDAVGPHWSGSSCGFWAGGRWCRTLLGSVLQGSLGTGRVAPASCHAHAITWGGHCLWNCFHRSLFLWMVAQRLAKPLGLAKPLLVLLRAGQRGQHQGMPSPVRSSSGGYWLSADTLIGTKGWTFGHPGSEQHDKGLEELDFLFLLFLRFGFHLPSTPELLSGSAAAPRSAGLRCSCEPWNGLERFPIIIHKFLLKFFLPIVLLCNYFQLC